MTRLTAIVVFLIMCLPHQAAGACPDTLTPPDIHVTVTEDEVAFARKTSEELAKLQPAGGGKEPYHNHEGAEVVGLMSSFMGLKHRLHFNMKEARGGRPGCVWLSRVDITIHSNPSVYLSRDHQNDACRYKQIFMHETAHLHTDRAVAAKYKSRIEDGLRMVLADKADYSLPLTQATETTARQYLESNVQGALDSLFAMMVRERTQRQQAHDTREEYRRISGACPQRKTAQDGF